MFSVGAPPYPPYCTRRTFVQNGKYVVLSEQATAVVPRPRCSFTLLANRGGNPWRTDYTERDTACHSSMQGHPNYCRLFYFHFPRETTTPGKAGSGASDGRCRVRCFSDGGRIISWSNLWSKTSSRRRSGQAVRSRR